MQSVLVLAEPWPAFENPYSRVFVLSSLTMFLTFGPLSEGKPARLVRDHFPKADRCSCQHTRRVSVMVTIDFPILDMASQAGGCHNWVCSCKIMHTCQIHISAFLHTFIDYSPIWEGNATNTVFFCTKQIFQKKEIQSASSHTSCFWIFSIVSSLMLQITKTTKDRKLKYFVHTVNIHYNWPWKWFRFRSVVKGSILNADTATTDLDVDFGRSLL